MQKDKLFNKSILHYDKFKLFEEIKNSLEEDLSLEQIKEIVDSPFDSLKRDLKKNQLFIYRFENFGTFYCNVGRAKHFLESVKNNVKRGAINKERGQEMISMLEDFIKRKS